MKTRFALSAGGIVVRPTDGGWETILASRRTKSGDLVWGLAKGQVEEGESPEGTAVREVREETGVTATVRAPLPDIQYWFVWEGERIRKTVVFFVMDWVEGDVADHDHEMEEVRWFPLDEAIERAGYDSERKLLEQARDALG